MENVVDPGYKIITLWSFSPNRSPSSDISWIVTRPHIKPISVIPPRKSLEYIFAKNSLMLICSQHKYRKAQISTRASETESNPQKSRRALIWLKLAPSSDDFAFFEQLLNSVLWSLLIQNSKGLTHLSVQTNIYFNSTLTGYSSVKIKSS